MKGIMLPTGISSPSPDAIIMREIRARNAARSGQPILCYCNGPQAAS